MVEKDEKYGRLTTVEIVGKTKNRQRIWRCICECGNEIDVPTGSLVTGNTRSCGCLLPDSARERGEHSRIKNKYDLSGEFGKGYTSKGEEFLFDLEDYEKIKDYTWRTNPDGYIISIPFGKAIRMHIHIMNPEKGFDVDHKNHIVSDNRKENLRVCEHYKNLINSKTYSNNTSGRKGVYYDKSRQKWMAAITLYKKQIHLGRFDKFEDAVKAREDAELKYHGEYHYDDSGI